MTEDSKTNGQGKSGLTGFLKNYGSLSAAIAAAAGGPLITTMIKVAPPSPPAPENLGPLSSFLTIPIILACYALNRKVRPSSRNRLTIVLLLLTLVSGIAYIWLYQTKTIALATQDRESAAKSEGLIAKVVYERIVIGNECTKEALQLNPRECESQFDLLKPEVLEMYKSGGLPSSLWTMKSVLQNSNTLLVTWFSFLACLSGVIGLMAAKGRSTSTPKADDKL